MGYQFLEEAGSVLHVAAQAENYMYEDKKNHYRKTLPKNRYRHYNDDIFGLTEKGMLKEKLEAGDFIIYLQPKIPFLDRSISGAEALIRYRQENGTIIAPAQFMPLLEDAKLIGNLDFYVFEQVCIKLALWLAEGRQAVPVSVNFSRYTLSERGFLTKLRTVFEKYQLDKKWVIIEVTESVKGIEDMNLLALIDNIRAEGFAVSIDDFGVDYANVSLFSTANFDELKIDRALVKHIVTNTKTQMVLESIIGICHKIGIRVVAEGSKPKHNSRP